MSCSVVDSDMLASSTSKSVEVELSLPASESAIGGEAWGCHLTAGTKFDSTRDRCDGCVWTNC